MMGFHGCCLRALGLLLWWVSEGALDLAFVCECWFMIYCYCVYCLLRWLSLQGWCDDSEEVLLMFSLFVKIRSGWANYIRVLSVWWMCCLLTVFIGFMCSMNAVVVCEFMMRDFLVCSLWTWCGNHSVIVVSSVESCLSGIVKWNDARSWIICCAKRRGLTGNGRIVRFAFSMVSCLSAGAVCSCWWCGLVWSYVFKGEFVIILVRYYRLILRSQAFFVLEAW